MSDLETEIARTERGDDDNGVARNGASRHTRQWNGTTTARTVGNVRQAGIGRQARIGSQGDRN